MLMEVALRVKWLVDRWYIDLLLSRFCLCPLLRPQPTTPRLLSPPQHLPSSPSITSQWWPWALRSTPAACPRPDRTWTPSCRWVGLGSDLAGVPAGAGRVIGCNRRSISPAGDPAHRTHSGTTSQHRGRAEKSGHRQPRPRCHGHRLLRHRHGHRGGGLFDELMDPSHKLWFRETLQIKLTVRFHPRASKNAIQAPKPRG